MKYLSIIDVSVRMDAEGRFCLNDLHRAAVTNGANARTKEPSKFLASNRTKRLIELLKQGTTQNLGSSIAPVSTLEGATGGTFVVKELVYAYGQFVSPEFDLHVIRSYDKVVQDEINRLNGIQYRALRAELDYQQGLREASVHGKGLRNWRDDKPLKLALLEDFRRALQPALFLN